MRLIWRLWCDACNGWNSFGSESSLIVNLLSEIWINSALRFSNGSHTFGVECGKFPKHVEDRESKESMFSESNAIKKAILSEC